MFRKNLKNERVIFIMNEITKTNHVIHTITKTNTLLINNVVHSGIYMHLK